MLGEGLTTAAPVQLAKFDESAFGRPRRRGPMLTAALLVAAVLVVALAAALG